MFFFFFFLCHCLFSLSIFTDVPGFDADSANPDLLRLGWVWTVCENHVIFALKDKEHKSYLIVLNCIFKLPIIVRHTM